MNFPFNVIVLDLETAGDPDQKLVEIGAVRLDERLAMTDEYEALVDGRPVSDEVVKIHGITDEMLEGKPKFHEIRREFEAWCEQWKPYALWSWSDFDHCTLRDEYRRLGIRYRHPGHAFDLKSVVWWEILKHGYPSTKLPVDRALSILGIPFEGQRHRALPDARMEARLLQFVFNHPGVWKLQEA